MGVSCPLTWLLWPGSRSSVEIEFFSVTKQTAGPENAPGQKGWPRRDPGPGRVGAHHLTHPQLLSFLRAPVQYLSKHCWLPLQSESHPGPPLQSKPPPFLTASSLVPASPFVPAIYSPQSHQRHFSQCKSRRGLPLCSARSPQVVLHLPEDRGPTVRPQVPPWTSRTCLH